jgi:protein tyrosine/serine phosphatase
VRTDRHLDWEGCYNARDLGGIPTADGRETRWGAVVRSDCPDGLSAAGWAALRAHGIRTIVDLRDDAERGDDPPGAAGLTTVRVPLDDADDTEFWTWSRDEGLDGTPLYYLPFLERDGKRERCVAAVAAVANAAPGGVVVHCGIGRDRTGLVSLLLLALVGVAAGDIAADYELSEPRLAPLRALLGVPEAMTADHALARKGTTARAAIRDTLAAVDVEDYLRAGGLGDRELAAVRSRLLGPA